MKKKVLFSILELIILIVVFYLVKFILFKLNVISEFSISMWSIIGFVVGWTTAEVGLYYFGAKK
mgnify:CR=1 FL=1